MLSHTHTMEIIMTSFIKHQYMNKPNRYYIDGKRVSKNLWDNLHFCSRYNFDSFLTVRISEDHYKHIKSGRA